MDHQSFNAQRSGARAIITATLGFEPQQEAEADRVSVQALSSVWPWVVAVPVMLGMLLLFHYVVHQAFQQGELRHKALAAHAAAIWRCNNLQGRDVSDRCLVQADTDLRSLALSQFKHSALAPAAMRERGSAEEVYD